MKHVTAEYALEIAAESEATILSRGGDVLSVLPYLDRSGIRPKSDLIGHSLALNAVIDSNSNVPPDVIRKWIRKHGVAEYLTNYEAVLLDREPAAISEQDKNNLACSLEAF